MERPRDSARERIIDAAEEVVIESGARHLTLQAVASKAGISRGGLLYHFPDKESLLRGMLDRMRKFRVEKRARKRAEIPASREREALVYVLTGLDEDAGEKQDLAAALVASGAHDPELLRPVREDYRKVTKDLTEDGLSFERAAVIILAVNGLRFLEVLSVSPYNAEEQHRIVGELVRLVKQNG